MKELRWHGREYLRLETVSTPTLLNADDVLLELAACVICDSDVEEWRAGLVAILPQVGASSPIILGHEFCGRVVQVGLEAVVPLGALVAVELNINCMGCYACREGQCFFQRKAIHLVG
jgi:(R,R)-butanediol dehydrogenase/meso-butanediol dehydrogenase/diacetyl reductase